MFLRSCSSSTDQRAAKRRVPASTAVFSNATTICGMLLDNSKLAKRLATPLSLWTIGKISDPVAPVAPADNQLADVPVNAVLR